MDGLVGPAGILYYETLDFALKEICTGVYLSKGA